MQDGFFKRSVIYMCEHNEQGSMGFMLNKPFGMLLKDIFPHLNNANFLLFEGGPVSTNQLFYTHTLGSKLSDSIRVTEDVYWGGNFLELSDMIKKNEISKNQIRFYIGYCGWDKDQLSDEIKNDSWFSAPADYASILNSTPENMWGNELIKISSSYSAFANFAFDPSLN